ncbi:MAG: tRNA epoxyqueuosine(34) reductase QueG [Anaerolineaceae bacterium]
MSLEADIKAEASALGFVLSGVALPQTPKHFPSYLTWLTEGCQAGMGYMARPYAVNTRRDPSQLLPGCCSILCLAMPYPPPAPAPPRGLNNPCGTIAAYAVLPDYHETLLVMLEKLISRIECLAGHPIKAYACVDTSPILEKDYAQQAGLGWIGRNSLLISPRYGSWLNLAEILTDLKLAPDQPFPEDPCLGCTHCVRACPTQALRPDRSVDARKCLSYLTVENRGSTPKAYQPLTGSRVFGCDLCQLACPHNQNFLFPNFNYVSLPRVNPYPELLAEFSLTEEAFKDKFQTTPIVRARYQGYRRNLAIALGNSGIQSAVPLLQQALQKEADPGVLDACRLALAQLASYSESEES